MDEIEILPEQGSPKAEQLLLSPSTESYNMSIRDYKSLVSPGLKTNKKVTNRIMGNRKKSPSEIDRGRERKRALAEIYDIVSEQESIHPTPLDSTVIPVCHYKGKKIPYKKRVKG